MILQIIKLFCNIRYVDAVGNATASCPSLWLSFFFNPGRVLRKREVHNRMEFPDSLSISQLTWPIASILEDFQTQDCFLLFHHFSPFLYWSMFWFNLLAAIHIGLCSFGHCFVALCSIRLQIQFEWHHLPVDEEAMISIFTGLPIWQSRSRLT